MRTNRYYYGPAFLEKTLPHNLHAHNLINIVLKTVLLLIHFSCYFYYINLQYGQKLNKYRKSCIPYILHLEELVDVL